MEAATIAAIATPSGLGGIGIIRISGPEALKILGKRNGAKTLYPERGEVCSG